MSFSNQPDVRQLKTDPFPTSPFPVSRSTDFRIHFHPAVHGRALAHAKEDTSVEICGVLVGDWGQDDDGPFARVTEIIRCDNATKKFAEVTFTHESWTQINREMDTKFAHLRIIGWYHSHPDFGIFLSDRDVFIQQNFFGGAGQIAFVVDPVRQAEGVFEWREGKPVLAAHYWVGGKIVAGESAARGTAAGHTSSGDASRHADGSIKRSTAATGGESFGFGGGRWTSLTTLLLLMLFFLLGYFLAGQRSRWEQLRLIEGTVAHYGLWQGVRPGLEEGLTALKKELVTVSDRVDVLSKEHIALAGDNAKEKTKEWSQIRESLAASRQLLKQLDDRYSLSPEEQMVLMRMAAQRLAELSAPQPKSPAKASTTEKNAAALPSDKSKTPPDKNKTQSDKNVEKSTTSGGSPDQPKPVKDSAKDKNPVPPKS